MLFYENLRCYFIAGDLCSVCFGLVWFGVVCVQECMLDEEKIFKSLTNTNFVTNDYLYECACVLTKAKGRKIQLHLEICIAR